MIKVPTLTPDSLTDPSKRWHYGGGGEIPPVKISSMYETFDKKIPSGSPEQYKNQEGKNYYGGERAGGALLSLQTLLTLSPSKNRAQIEWFPTVMMGQ